MEKFTDCGKGTMPFAGSGSFGEKRCEVAALGNQRGQNIDAAPRPYRVEADRQDFRGRNFLLMKLVASCDFSVSTFGAKVKVLGYFPPETPMKAGSNDNLA